MLRDRNVKIHETEMLRYIRQKFVGNLNRRLNAERISVILIIIKSKVHSFIVTKKWRWQKFAVLIPPKTDFMNQSQSWLQDVHVSGSTVDKILSNIEFCQSKFSMLMK